MKNILNITNGDCAVEVMKKAGIDGIFLPWRDVLHDGPVPQNMGLKELSEVRAKFILDRTWGSPQNIERDFIERDNILKSFEDYEKVILWFEHDLYDQLQILQILDWFHENGTENSELSIICVDQYLGPLSPSEMKGLFKFEKPITKDHLSLAGEAWLAFRSDSPKKWYELIEKDTSALPFMEGAVVRVLEEYPSGFNGLSRTAHQALKVIASGEGEPWNIFSLNQELEERVFLGDSGFWVILQELLNSEPALLESSKGRKLILPIDRSQKLSITAAGMEVLLGKKSWLDIVDIDRWIGGVHLKSNNIWYWGSGSITNKPPMLKEV